MYVLVCIICASLTSLSVVSVVFCVYAIVDFVVWSKCMCFDVYCVYLIDLVKLSVVTCGVFCACDLLISLSAVKSGIL